MANQTALACLLIVTSLVLLALVNQLGWLLWLVPVALLFSTMFSARRSRNVVARELKKG